MPTEYAGIQPNTPFQGHEGELDWKDTPAIEADLTAEHAGEASVGDTSAEAARVAHTVVAQTKLTSGGLIGVFSRLLHPFQSLSPLGSVSSQLATDLHDPALHPELTWTANLRRANSLSAPESAYLPLRLARLTGSRRSGGLLATFLQLEDADEVVHLSDIPIIGFGGSGGGMRASLGFGAVCEAMKAEGLWEFVTYIAGVSGSCWAIGSYYTWGERDWGKVMDKFERTGDHHPLSSTAVEKVAKAKGGLYEQWAPILLKAKSGNHLTLLDFYGTFVTTYMWIPPTPSVPSHSAHSKDGPEPELKREWFHWSRTWRLIEKGGEPLPILTAVRHERPWKDWKDPTEPFADTDHANTAEHTQAQNAWWQWFEITPAEIGCDELEGWVPTWSFGRRFAAGTSTQRLPEQSLSLLLGLSTSAPAGPLSSYLGTIYRNLPSNVFGNAIKTAASWVGKEMGAEGEERFEDQHPVHAANEPNPFFGAKKEAGRGQGIENSPRVHLIDSGMSNNCPTHVFCHPARTVDIGAALDRISDFGKEVGLALSPRASLPPLADLPKDKDGQPVQLTPEQIAKRFEGWYAQVLDGKPVGPQVDCAVLNEESGEVEYANLPEGWTHKALDETASATTTQKVIYNDRHQPQMTRPLRMVYVPLLPHACQPSYDPSTAKFSSSYNLVWSAEQVQTIRKTAAADFGEGVEVVRALVREVYEEKKARRLAVAVNVA